MWRDEKATANGRRASIVHLDIADRSTHVCTFDEKTGCLKIIGVAHDRFSGERWSLREAAVLKCLRAVKIGFRLLPTSCSNKLTDICPCTFRLLNKIVETARFRLTIHCEPPLHQSSASSSCRCAAYGLTTDNECQALTWSLCREYMICPLPRANDLTAPRRQPGCHGHR